MGETYKADSLFVCPENVSTCVPRHAHASGPHFVGACETTTSLLLGEIAIVIVRGSS